MKLILPIVLLTAFLIGCSKSGNEPSQTPGETLPEMELLAHVTGTVRSASGAPVPNASVHIVYDELPAPVERRSDHNDSPNFPTQALLFTYDTMKTECGGSDILPDGVTVKIFWDSDSDGIDNEDPQPPVCLHPPSCADGPSQTVNYNQFVTNGSAVGVPGGFITDVDFFSVGDALVPSRYYVRIYCEDGNPLYTSQVVEIPDGYSDVYLNMTCTACDGAPPIQQWKLDPAYPNPVLNTTTVHFGLAEAAQTQIWLRRVGIENYDVPVNESLGSGFYSRTLDLSGKPNGAYIYALFAGPYQATDTLIKNVTAESALRGTTAGAVTESDGTFSLYVPCNITTELRDADNAPQGEIILNRARIVAAANGFQLSDTTLDLTPQTEYSINLSVSPQ